MTFKAGDKVRALETRHSNNDTELGFDAITDGCVYTVSKLNTFDTLNVDTDNDLSCGWDCNIFELVESAPEPTEEYFYLVKSPVTGKSYVGCPVLPEELSEEILPEVLRQLQWCVTELNK